eukprot:CAMPEP_0197524474 /NCGR_PEP_ID=MMETSP1318-20131121/9145_1 /TAXON_ID=552666 /ORGANISM="Partenskyella glossopodia, Strain RCC365" /LENGTH=495 /DNA_ID=CAMNT_0043077445 /DNA_START=333 /DNA_END=1817 /DNA_ORIENTATION=+
MAESLSDLQKQQPQSPSPNSLPVHKPNTSVVIHVSTSSDSGQSEKDSRKESKQESQSHSRSTNIRSNNATETERSSSEAGKSTEKSLGSGGGTMDLETGLQAGSTITLKGTYNAACFAVELQNRQADTILNHINFRPKGNVLVSSTYLGDWGEEYYASKYPLVAGKKFKLVLTVIGPEKEHQPYGLHVSVDGDAVYDKLLLPNFNSIRKAAVHEKCAKNGARNDYSTLRAERLPETSVAIPSMAYDERVTPEKASGDTMMLIGILSAPKHKDQRGAQRRAWLQHQFCKSGKALARFFVGMSGDAKIDKMVAEEAQRTGDIVILPDLQDSYYKIAAKTAAMVHMAVGINADFLLKCDDDTYVDVDQVFQGIKGQGGGLVLAAITYNGGAQRDGKWAMPVEDFPGARYPPFPHGPGYVIGKDILKHADEKLKAGELRPLALEDVSMGVWIDSAKKNGVRVNYQSRKGKRKGSVNIGGCHPGAMISHYMLPEQMVCMW